MVFPPYRVLRLKEELASRAHPDDLELAIRIHEIDPDDPTGLLAAAVARVQAQDPAGALGLFWRLATVHPYIPTPYMFAAMIENDVNGERALAAGLLDLAIRKQKLHAAARKQHRSWAARRRARPRRPPRGGSGLPSC